jgi:hypothetical protein
MEEAVGGNPADETLKPEDCGPLNAAPSAPIGSPPFSTTVPLNRMTTRNLVSKLAAGASHH